MPLEEIIEPVSYPWWMLAAALGAIAIVVIGWIVLARLTRPRQYTVQTPASLPVVHPDSAGDPWRSARLRALAAIDDIEVRHAQGSLPDRHVYLELAAVTREFTAARVGLPATVMTLTDLQQHKPAEPAAQIIGQLYRPEFDAHSQADIARMLDQAREAISRW